MLVPLVPLVLLWVVLMLLVVVLMLLPTTTIPLEELPLEELPLEELPLTLPLILATGDCSDTPPLPSDREDERSDDVDDVKATTEVESNIPPDDAAPEDDEPDDDKPDDDAKPFDEELDGVSNEHIRWFRSCFNVAPDEAVVCTGLLAAVSPTKLVVLPIL
jgi:hypothetical protein